MDKNEQAIRYDKWRNLIEEHEKSGLSQVAFCKQEGIPVSHFCYYRSRIKVKNTPSHAVFSPIHLHKQSVPCDIQILLPNGLKCIMPSATDAACIKQIVGVLLSC